MSNGINFARTFGSSSTNVDSAATTKADLPKANVWLNIGYTVETDDAENPTMFVSLPVGIPLDTMDEKAVTSRSPIFAQFQAAGNGLLADLKAEAASLAPGEEKIYGDEGGLQIQMRRVADAIVAPLNDATNPFRRNVVG